MVAHITRIVIVRHALQSGFVTMLVASAKACANTRARWAQHDLEVTGAWMCRHYTYEHREHTLSESSPSIM